MEELKSFCDVLINQTEGDLLTIRLEHVESEKWAQASIPYLKNSLDTLNKYIQDHPFRKRSEEIYFFKYIKPVVMGRLIFMCEVHNIEAFRGAHHTEKDKEFLNSEVQQIEKYFERHHHLYEYYKNGDDILDTIFFVRNVEDRFNKRDLPVEIDPVFFYGDSNFSTGFDYAFAKLRAMELLRDHLEIEIEASELSGNDIPETEHNFIGTPADFVVLVKMVKEIGMPPNPGTGKPFTEEELFEELKNGMKTGLPDDMDFHTLKLISGNSDLPEKMLDLLDKQNDKWDEEDRDIDYDVRG